MEVKRSSRSSIFSPVRSHTASKLPSYRPTDLIGPGLFSAMAALINTQNDISHGLRTAQEPPPQPEQQHSRQQKPSSSSSSEKVLTEKDKNLQTVVVKEEKRKNNDHDTKVHKRHRSAADAEESETVKKIQETLPSARPKTSADTTRTFPSTTRIIPVENNNNNNNTRPKSARRSNKAPASHSRKDVAVDLNPPLAMITPRSFPFETSTTSTTQNWVETQQAPTTAHNNSSPTTSQHSPHSSLEGTPSRPKILPIRGLQPSSRRNSGMALTRNSIIQDPDSTVRGLEGFESLHGAHQMEQEEQNSDESDLFLRAAKEEESMQRSHMNERLVRSDRRRSYMARPPASQTNPNFQPTLAQRRGSDHERVIQPRNVEEQENSSGQYSAYRSTPRDRPSALDDINKSRYFGSNSRSNPTTPRTLVTNRDISPESQVSYGGRRPSIPENNVARASSYRQSNLSYSTPRTYNSSPLVSRTIDAHIQEDTEAPRAADETNSSVSATAPSTMWDELDELKSRIHRLELTGKLPTTSGAAISRASHDRPPTATTTMTTISSSPKRGRNNSISPIDSSVPEQPEHHPLLHSALAKSKPLLHPDVFKALEAATLDAVAISQMMGVSGQPGPLSTQSIVGGPSGVSDRQVRRKADSMCRSLTELCLALSEGKNDHPVSGQVTQANIRPGSRDTDLQQSIEAIPNSERLGMGNDLLRVKSSPRSFSRLEARRSSLLTSSALPAPRYNLNDSSTPTQSAMSNRRTSLLLRSTRRGTEEPEEEDELQFRAPSRATTEVGRLRNSPRDYFTQPKLSDRLPDRYADRLPERSGTVQSNLPIRRTYTTNSANNTPPSMPPVSNLGGRRYLERGTPDRDVNQATTSRLGEERAQRKASLSTSSALPTRTGSLTRKTRQGASLSADMSAGQRRDYQ